MLEPGFGMCLQGGEKQGKVQKLSKGEVLMLNIGSMCTGARVIAVSPSFHLAVAASMSQNACGVMCLCKWRMLEVR